MYSVQRLLNLFQFRDCNISVQDYGAGFVSDCVYIKEKNKKR